MIDILKFTKELFKEMPDLAIFISLAIGYAIGNIKFGTFRLGGVAGSLIAGVFVSLIGVDIDDTTKSVLFALFIFAVGYESGPDFFRSLGKKTLNEVFLALMVALFSFGTIIAVAKLFHLDKGLAAGVAAGGLTQSAIMGVASDALSKLGLSANTLKEMQANIGVGYAVTYIFGTLGAILVCAVILPKFMGKGLHEAAIEAEAMGHGKVALDGGQSHALHELIGRVYKVTSDSMGSVSGVESATDSPVTIEKIKRDGKIIDVTSGLDLKKDDLILLVGKREAIVAHAESIGLEVAKDRDLNIVMKTLEVVVTKSDVRGTALSDLREKMADSIQHGIFILSASRSGSVFGDTDEVTLKEGDILKIYGSDADVDRAASYIGKPIIPSIMTDLCFTALGVVVGLLIGALTVKAGSVPLTLGSGGGALVSGLIFGWFKGRRPQFGGTIPTPALQFMKDIGLAGFVAIVGLDSGLQAFTTIKEQGVNILIAGLIVTFVPLLITMLLGKYVLRYKNSAIFGGALSGARSANPAFGQVLSLSGNAVPTVPFAITYALANVFLTLLGPLVVAFA